MTKNHLIHKSSVIGRKTGAGKKILNFSPKKFFCLNFFLLWRDMKLMS
jgi:hypothetical protein